MSSNQQLSTKHILGIKYLTADDLHLIFKTATEFKDVINRPIKKVPSLRDITIANLFFENSTRTRTTFELAAKRLSADLVNLDIRNSAASKGESLLDTIRNIEAMGCDMFVVRHASSSAAHFIAKYCASHISVINAGDGRHAHPTQAMLDMLTIRRHKGSFDGLKVAIVGDILHSRVARSQLHALTTLGVEEVRLVGPKTLVPEFFAEMGATICHDLEVGLKDVDVVVMLRLQKERMKGALLPSEGEFYRLYGLTEESLSWAKPDAIVMHPGPINRGVEISSEVADGDHSVILDQVTNGIAVRMAVLSMAMSGQLQSDEASTAGDE